MKILSILLLGLLSSNARAVILEVSWFNTIAIQVPQGSLVQLGILLNTPEGSTNPFDGDFLEIDSLQLGQNSKTDGFYDGFTTIDTTTSPLASQIENGDLFAVRFFNNFTVEDSTAFNTVTSLDWDIFILPGQPTQLIPAILGSPSPVLYEDGASSALQATIPIPEPSSALLLAFGCLSLLKRKR